RSPRQSQHAHTRQGNIEARTGPDLTNRIGRGGAVGAAAACHCGLRSARDRAVLIMTRLAISLAISDYDHVRDFVSGRVTAEGLDINFQVLPTPEIFDRATRDQEWDVSEMSLGKWTGMFSQGNDSLVPIPVFPSRVFRHSALYVKKGSGVDP